MIKLINKNWLKISLLTLFSSILVMSLPNVAFAQELTSLEATEKITDYINLIQGFENMINSLLWPMLLMIGGLLDNSLLFGSGMEERMREIWIPIRNIINILFVVALIGIALYNVLGRAEEGGDYAIKAILPKLIVGIIAVNFSFLGIKVFLDAVNVLTVSIFSMPDQMSIELSEGGLDPTVEQRYCAASQGTEYTKDKKAERDVIDAQTKKYKKKAALIIQSNPGTEMTQTELADKFKEDAICNGFNFTTKGERFFETYGSHNAALLFVLGLGNVVFYQDVPVDADNIDKLFSSSLFSLLLYIVYVVSFMALFIVLLARLVVMWLSIVLSPVLLLGMAVPAAGEKLELVKKVSDEFMKHAIAPLGIALSMTIGWIMLKSMKSAQSLSVVGYRTDSAGELITGAVTGFPVVGLNTLQDIVVEVGVVGVVWLGVFTAAGETIAGPVTEWMKGTLLGIGKWVAKAPFYYTPGIPVKIGGEEFAATPAEIVRGVEAITRPPLSDRISRELNHNVVDSLTEVRDATELTRFIIERLNNGNRRDAADLISSNKNLVEDLPDTVEKLFKKFAQRGSTTEAREVRQAARDAQKQQNPP
ncbi:hypothetical protein GF354_00515 [Candidatus Peregrinibacteria bacterium]|nr:hypothetical protein [Candidatus Peregrinibacteria bacterium]